MAFSNTITLAQKYLPLLDEVYKATARTAILDGTNIEFIGANTVKLFKTEMNGMGNYSRDNGFVDGNVTAGWETLTLAKDRGRGFQIDRMDNEETLGQAFGTLAGEFVRTQVVPEIDAYTFAKIAGTTGIQTVTGADITPGTTDVPGLIDAAEAALNEYEVPNEGRLLFISEATYHGLKAKITRQVMNDVTGINKEVEVYNGARIIRVPQNRFYTAITMYDGTTSGQTDGGYIGTTTTGYKINFLYLHPSAIAKCVKHSLPRIFTPDENQTADAWKFQYRVYYDTFVRTNKVKGIYLHKGATALS